MKVSVIVCTKDRLKSLIRFYNSLILQTELPDEFIIVDGSTIPINQSENYKSKINDFKKTKIYYYNTEPGLTKQRNNGISKATGDIIYFFDDDIILEHLFLEKMNFIFINFPEFYAGMGLMTNYDHLITFKEILILSIKRFFLLSHAYGSGKFYKSGFASHPYGQNMFLETNVLAGGLTGYRKDVFKYFSFDDSLTGYSYMEDDDFSKRLTKKYKAFYNPKARCYHDHAEGGRGDTYNNKKMLIYNHRYFFYKNFNYQNIFFRIAHYWSIFGLFVCSPSINAFRGYIKGLKDFNQNSTYIFK